MLAEFSVWPLDRPHMSEDIASITQVLDQAGVRYQVGAMGTTIEGEWHDVMEAIHACHKTLRAAHQRVLTTITIDDDATRALKMSESTAKVSTRQEETKSK